MVEFELDSKDVKIYFLWKKEDEDGWKQSLEVNPLRSTRFPLPVRSYFLY